MEITVLPADESRFDDVATLLAPRRADAPACWCLSWRVSSSEFNALHGDERQGRLRELCRAGPAPGVVAYVTGDRWGGGAPGLEAYPVDPAGGRISGALAYVGTTGMFERAGFRRVGPTGARSAGLTRWLMRLDLTGPAEP